MIMMKSNFKNIVMTSFQWRHYVTENRHQTNGTNFFPIWVPAIKTLATPVDWTTSPVGLEVQQTHFHNSDSTVTPNSYQGDLFCSFSAPKTIGHYLRRC